MVKIVRETNNTYCIIDYIYINDKLIGTQSNTIGKNKYKAKTYKRYGKVYEVDKWEQIGNFRKNKTKKHHDNN